VPGLTTLASAVLSKLGERKSVAALYEYDDQDNITSDGIQFQYFPESITDNKAVTYQQREIPGGSLPLYQWISSGERVITFTAFFSADVDFTQSTTFPTLRAQGQISRNVDIRTALLALRRYLLPRYKSSGSSSPLGVPLTLAPRKLVLLFSNSGLGLLGGISGDSGDSTGVSGNSAAILTQSNHELDAIDVIMTQCDIMIDSIFPSGLPRLAQVQLSFAQIAQKAGMVNFPSAGNVVNAIVNAGATTGSNTVLYPYPLRTKWQ
jgi:hypothetical protein